VAGKKSIAKDAGPDGEAVQDVPGGESVASVAKEPEDVPDVTERKKHAKGASPVPTAYLRSGAGTTVQHATAGDSVPKRGEARRTDTQERSDMVGV